MTIDRIDALQFGFGGNGFRQVASNAIVFIKQGLTLQVGSLDKIAIDDSQATRLPPGPEDPPQPFRVPPKSTISTTRDASIFAPVPVSPMGAKRTCRE